MLCVAGLWAPGVGAAEQPGGVILDSNEQLFSILAARALAGYDSGSGGGAGIQPRTELREFLAGKSVAILPELRKFFVEHQIGNDAGADLGQYISLGLLLGPPPDFALRVSPTDLPPDAKSLVGLTPLLKTLYEQAKLIELWARLQPYMRQETERYAGEVRKSIERSDAYLRFPSGAYLGRTYAIYLSPLGLPEQVHARIYGQNYYLVITPSQEPKLAEIRHQYLHFLLDPLAVRYAPEINQKSDLRNLARQAGQLGSDFKEDFPLLVTECLIRAVELRMDKRPPAEAQKSVEEMAAAGLILGPYFYSALGDYEKQEASMNLAYKSLILGVDPAREKTRLATVKFTPREEAAGAKAPLVVAEQDRLLDQADNFIYDGRYHEARAVFKDVLERIDPRSERALFGMAVVASNTRKPDLAEDYFLKTLEVARDLRIATWAHIYLGRLYDLKGRRQEALEQYRAASLTASSYPEAIRAVQAGLQVPYGSKP